MYTAGATVCPAPPVSWVRADARRLRTGPRAATAARRSDGRRRGSSWWPEPPARGPVQVHGARKGGSPARSTAAMAAGGEVKDIHSKESTKTLLKSEALYEYMLNTMVYPRENEHLRELRLITEQHTYGFMLSPPDEEQLLSLLLKVMGARNTIEVGVFTGGSVLATALAIPDDGRIVAIDVSREYFDLGRPVIEKAGVAHKVDFREGPALHILADLLADEGNEGAFDFAFVDADKENYGNYHEQLLRLVRVGGVLAYDNTLWGGSVALPDDAPLTEGDREMRAAVRAFNARVAGDARVEAVQLPVADGITLCRRVV
ncbi:hypothetical protein GQ55_6G239800 [Panicum hallii var. hallii]|uniref:Caffeoyl-CoA O-methyltransferase n=3 Tax=Panicum hallii TaxID=206008 RepID=A0A2T7D916_9POAL|nr:hypothetical protein GQ55_6G239800 [Panicum hallii var. hallii]